MLERLTVLMAEASAADAERIAEGLRLEGYDVGMERVQRAADMIAALDRQRWDLVLANDALPGFDAIAVLRVLREHAQATSSELLPLIVISDSADSIDNAREAMREGARDVVARGDLLRLPIAIERELRDRAARDSRRAADASVAQAEKLEAVSRLAGGVAHDFNNLLTAILAYSDSLLYQLPLDSALRMELSEIKKSAERATALTQRLLAFARRRPVKPQPTMLNALIRGLEPALRRLLGDHVEIVMQLAPDVGLVRVDLAQFEQALLSLVTNARDAMPAGGTLTLRTANVDAETIALTITDTGCGMDASTQARAFEPFFTTREAGQGSGLGLPMAYGAIQQIGGTLSLTSEVGRGTTVTIQLPRVAQTDAEPAVIAAPTPAPEAATETILLVEDEELVRQMAVLTLERRGYQVLIARDGTDALARAQAHAGDLHLLIADLVMPRMGGQELARVLRLARPALRVLHMIAYGDEALVKEVAAADPLASFLQKPFVATALVDRVRDALAVAVAAGRSPGRTGN